MFHPFRGGADIRSEKPQFSEAGAFLFMAERCLAALRGLHFAEAECIRHRSISFEIYLIFQFSR